MGLYEQSHHSSLFPSYNRCYFFSFGFRSGIERGRSHIISQTFQELPGLRTVFHIVPEIHATHKQLSAAGLHLKYQAERTVGKPVIYHSHYGLSLRSDLGEFHHR